MHYKGAFQLQRWLFWGATKLNYVYNKTILQNPDCMWVATYYSETFIKQTPTE